MQFSFNVFPVPVESIINISSETAFSNITISDLQGKVLYSGIENAIDVGNYPQGTYFIQVESDKGIAAKIFTKQ